MGVVAKAARRGGLAAAVLCCAGLLAACPHQQAQEPAAGGAASAPPAEQPQVASEMAWRLGPVADAGGFHFITVYPAEGLPWPMQSRPQVCATPGVLSILSTNFGAAGKQAVIHFYQLHGDIPVFLQHYDVPKEYGALCLAWADGKVVSNSMGDDGYFKQPGPALHNYDLVDLGGAPAQVLQHYSYTSDSPMGMTGCLAHDALSIAFIRNPSPGELHPLTLWHCPAGKPGRLASDLKVRSLGYAWVGSELLLAAIDASGKLLLDEPAGPGLAAAPAWAQLSLDPAPTYLYDDLAVAAGFAAYRVKGGVQLATAAGEHSLCSAGRPQTAPFTFPVKGKRTAQELPLANTCGEEALVLPLDAQTVLLSDNIFGRLTLVRLGSVAP